MTGTLPFLPYGRHHIDRDDIEAVTEVLRSGWLTTGPEVARFEAELAKATGARHALACNSGTAALHLAAMALDLGPGDVVVVPAITFVATANVVRLVGAQVAFSDVDPDTGLMRPQDLDAAVARNPGAAVKAVFPVHLAGQCVDLAGLDEVAAPRGIAIVEDACHALGSSQGAVSVGSCPHSQMACFSFHAVKTIAMGEGGAVTTNDPAAAERMARWRSHGITRDAGRFVNADLAFADQGSANPWYYEMQELGLNYRASDIACALGRSQLAKLERFRARRAGLVALYDRALEPLAEVVTPIARVAGCEPAWHLYPVLIDFPRTGKSRAQVMRELHEAGIGTQVHYIPVPLQPYYRGEHDVSAVPGACRYYERTLSLPLFIGMEDADIERVVGSLGETLRK